MLSGAKWEVHSDRGAPSKPNVLEGAGPAEAPLAIFDKVVCRDGDLSVKFRLQGDQRNDAAGVVWHYQDPANYDLLTLGEGRPVELARIRNGKKQLIVPNVAGSAAVDIASGLWHIVKVSFRGPRVQVFLGNRILFTAQDPQAIEAGKTGLWVSGNGGASFDDFRIDKKS